MTTPTDKPQQFICERVGYVCHRPGCTYMDDRECKNDVLPPLEVRRLDTHSAIAPIYADALDAVVELVRLKRIKERIEQAGLPNGPNNAELTDLERDYKFSKPAAWGFAMGIADDSKKAALSHERRIDPDTCSKCGLFVQDGTVSGDACPGHDEPEIAPNGVPYRDMWAGGAGAAPSSTEPLVTVREDVMRYLLGEGPLDGLWFGEDKVREGRYWWRTPLRRSMHPYTPPSASATRKGGCMYPSGCDAEQDCNERGSCRYKEKKPNSFIRKGGCA